MVGSTVSTIGKYYGIVKPHVKVANKLTYDPDFSKNADLYFLLTYLRKKTYYGSYYKSWSLQKIFFRLVSICDKKEPYDKLVRIISSLVKEKIQFARNNDLKLAQEKEDAIGNILSKWYYYQKVY